MARRTHKYLDGSAISLAAEVTALPFPPVTYADVSSTWVIENDPTRAVPELRVAIWANLPVNLTNAELVAAVLHTLPALVVADAINTVVFASNTLTVTAHKYEQGDGPFQLTTTDTLPTGLSLATDYYIISNTILGANTIQLATTRALAVAGTAVAFSDIGVGTHTITATATATRPFWHGMGLLGNAADGAVVLTADRAWLSGLIKTFPTASLYGLVATLSAATPELVSAAIYPATDA